MLIKAKETKLMVSTLQLDISLNPPISILRENIEQVKVAKPLGVTLDDHLSFNEHVRNAINKTRAAVHNLLA